jgi:hypothetical protein
MRIAIAEPVCNSSLFRSESQKILMKWIQKAGVVVCIVMDNRLDNQSKIPGRGKRFFFLFHSIQNISGAHPTSY